MTQTNPLYKPLIMDIYFDIQKFNDPTIDAKFMEVIFDLRKEVEIKLSPFKKDLEKEHAAILIVFTPEKCGITGIGLSESLSKKIIPIADGIDFSIVIRKVVNATLN